MCFQRPVLAASMAVILIFFGIGIMFLIPQLTLALAKAWSIKLDDDSTSYHYWVQNRKPIVSQKYFFNITNPYEVLEGKKPVVQEVGPYTYIAIMRKVNISFGGKDRVSYNNKFSIEFLRSESVGSESDLITTVNPELLVALSRNNEISELLAGLIRHIYSYDPFGGLFVTQPIHQLLNGKIGPLFRAANITTPIVLAQPKNESIYPRMTVYTGKHDYDDILTLVRFNNAEDLPYWKRRECSSLRGLRADASGGPPIDDDDIHSIRIFMFGSRGVKWNVVDDDYDIDAYDWEFNVKKLVPDVHLFDNMYDYPDNDCYESTLNSPDGYQVAVVNGTTVKTGMPSGVYDLTAVMNAPVLLSHPHFGLADPYFRNSIQGINQQPDFHRSELFIEPKTGISINCSHKVQLNLPLNPRIKEMQFKFSKAPAIVYPIMWQATETGIARSAAKKLYLIVETSWVIGFSIGPLFSLFGCILLYLAAKLIQTENRNLRPPAYPSGGQRVDMTYSKSSQPEDQDWVATSTF